MTSFGLPHSALIIVWYVCRSRKGDSGKLRAFTPNLPEMQQRHEIEKMRDSGLCEWVCLNCGVPNPIERAWIKGELKPPE
ncbi:hypothetical protein [Tardiphaga sp.]|uniref:hypothetical protein n=1 Tax=Tardiphaga sp. TaxID=1926292 RepID=UPI002622C1EA|nr:hypothetical protein [Tardiphaga sp.]